MKQKNKEKNPKENILKESNTLDGWTEIKGYNFEEEFSLDKFLKSFYTQGFQSTEIFKATALIKEMRENNAKIFLGFTSNMGTCGVRENITYLTKNKLIYGISTTIGAIEEDIIKIFKPWVLGDWSQNGDILREKGINKTGNIFCPNDRYIYFERFMNRLLEELYKEQKEKNKIFSNYIVIQKCGELIEKMLENNEIEEKRVKRSFVYWSYINKIKIYPSVICDGSFGDMIYFFKKNNPDFLIDETNYIVDLTDKYLNSEKVGVIIIGGSTPKHMLCNAGIFRDGIDYSIFINNNTEYDGSNCGTNINEAKSWGKISKDSKNVKIECEASIIFPLLILGGFTKNL